MRTTDKITTDEQPAQHGFRYTNCGEPTEVLELRTLEKVPAEELTAVMRRRLKVLRREPVED
jgi:hypothetical protein